VTRAAKEKGAAQRHRKGGDLPGRAKREQAAALRVAAAPLHELARDQLSVFLYLALLPEETRSLVKELGLSVPGFRAGALGDVERCDVLADEIRARPAAAEGALRALEAAFQAPPLPRHPLDPASAEELLRLAGNEAGLALAAWRVLSDRSAAVRAAAGPVLEELVRHYYGPPEGGDAGEASGDEPGARRAGSAEDPSQRAERLERDIALAGERAKAAAAAAEAKAEEQRRRTEEQREKLRAALREARARESQLAAEAARAREDLEGARRELARARAELDALRASDAVADAQRSRAEARDLEARGAALAARLERAREHQRELEAALQRARAGTAAGVSAPPPDETSGGEGTDAGPEDDLATWLLPVHTREFHDSLARWDRRIQRAAFKQAHLLALDHRHPSLRALPLEGLPGYYRVRVATDVRLIYRRAERQNRVEILSLIDREDLDRYIRQAKTRG